MIENLYPEIANAGSLAKALDKQFETIKSSLRCTIDHNRDRPPFSYARVENNKRVSQVYLAADEKLYLSDFWRDGVCLAYGQTSSIDKLTEILNYWLSSDATTELLQDKFKFIKVSEKAKAFDDNNEVEYTWNSILNDSSRTEIRSFVELAIIDNVLSKLFPFTSLMRLCFSRCTGYPYTFDTPMVIPVSENIYEVRLSNNDIVGIGTATDALKMVKENLPLDIQPAIVGTAKDL